VRTHVTVGGLLAVCGDAFHQPTRGHRVRRVDFDINDAVDMCGAALHTRYSREFDIAVFDKYDAFSRLLQWLAAGTKVQSRYKQKFKLSEFNIIIIIIIIQHLYSAIVSYAGCRGACGAS